MLKRKLTAAIISAVFLASAAIVPIFAQEPTQNGMSQEQGNKMNDSKMKDDKMSGDKMSSKKHRRHKKSAKPKADDKMESRNGQ